MARIVPRPTLQRSIRFRDADSVALLHDARPPPPAPAARAARARHDRRGRRRAAVHARRPSRSSSRCSSARPACALLERAGRGVRLTDPALVLVGHAGALLERAARGRGRPRGGRGHGHRPRADRRLPVGGAAARAARRCEALGARRAAAALRARRGRARAGAARAGARRRRPRARRRVAAPAVAAAAGLERHELLRDPVRLVLPAAPPARAPPPRRRAARRARRRGVGDRPRRRWAGRR